MPLLMKDLMVLYATHGDESVLPRAASYRNYLSWLNSRDAAESELAWGRGAVRARAADPARRGKGLAGSSTGTVESVVTQLETELAEHLGAFSARQRRHIEHHDAGQVGESCWRASWVERMSCSVQPCRGRPPELDHVESMVGLFINTLPVRVTIDPAESLRSLLSRLQAEQAALLEHHQLGLTEIVKSVGNAADFDTLTVFESYPVDTEGIAATSSIDGMTVTAITCDDATHYSVGHLPLLPMTAFHSRSSISRMSSMLLRSRFCARGCFGSCVHSWSCRTPLPETWMFWGPDERRPACPGIGPADCAQRNPG